MKRNGTSAWRRGVTLIEMVIVVAIIGLMAGLSFPSVVSGLDSIRLRSGADDVAAFLSTAMNRAERRQEVVEVVADPQHNRVLLVSTDPGFTRTLELPPNIRIAGESEAHMLLLPGGAFPRFSIDLVNPKGLRRRISIDPITSAPEITIPVEEQP